MANTTDAQVVDWINKNMPHFRRIDDNKIEMTFVSDYAFEVVVGNDVRDCVAIVLDEKAE